MNKNIDMYRDIVFSDDLTTALKRGIDKLCNAVKTTMGPKGKLVLIQRINRHPLITKDGVTVAQSINLVDQIENLGAQIIKEAASRTAEEAGDGTTTATVLAQSIFTEGLKMKAAGYDLEDIKAGINLGVETVLNSLNSQKKSVSGKEDLMKVATISANGEKDIADLIVKAINAAGPDGHVIVEEAKGFKSNLTLVDGYQLERGYLSPYFVTDKNKMSCQFEKPLILLADREFNSIRELMKPLELALETNRSILIIANEVDGDAMQGLVLNRVKGSLRICALKSPGFGATRHDMLNDLESVVGGKVINSSFDMQEFKMDMFGTCNNAIINKNNSLIICDDQKNNTKIQSRIESVKKKLDYPGITEDEKELLKFRLQSLSGSIAILRVGAATESELIERYDRVDDALNATRAALEEGILPGGGVALVKAAAKVDSIIGMPQYQNMGAGLNIVSRSCKEPFKQIIKNSGKSPETVLNSILNTENNLGYDARNDILGDMFSIGIVDPSKVVRCAIEYASSAAIMLLSSGCAMIEVSKN